MTNLRAKVFQRVDDALKLLMTQEDLNEEEKFMIALTLGKECLQIAFASAAYSCRVNPEPQLNLQEMKKSFMKWIKEGIAEGNKRYEKELN